MRVCLDLRELSSSNGAHVSFVGARFNGPPRCLRRALHLSSTHVCVHDHHCHQTRCEGRAQALCGAHVNVPLSGPFDPYVAFSALPCATGVTSQATAPTAPTLGGERTCCDASADFQYSCTFPVLVPVGGLHICRTPQCHGVGSESVTTWPASACVNAPPTACVNRWQASAASRPLSEADVLNLLSTCGQDVDPPSVHQFPQTSPHQAPQRHTLAVRASQRCNESRSARLR